MTESTRWIFAAAAFVHIPGVPVAGAASVPDAVILSSGEHCCAGVPWFTGAASVKVPDTWVLMLRFISGPHST